ncbi:uncharacterized protein LOC6042079 [Culex quinquefasciatus]|uniref:uncharacterized protein LOC6042079 n=1 Tax=Culex quinquefasciatus TaxID=7176 RepID=UPI0018E2CE24|nr:uncharacterized protein LOC6042079 [Culex quinquefasciatus]
MIRAIRGTSFSVVHQRRRRQKLAISVVGLIIVVVLLDRSYASQGFSASSGDDHSVCIRYESYTTLETVPRNQTVQVLTREWCLEIPPRCTSYRPEIKEVYVKQNVTKTRKIEYCCEGYEEQPRNSSSEEASPNGLACRPICRGGCGRGQCTAPNVCSCEAGITGKHCNQRCRNGTWGENCKQRCHCQNYSLCEGKTGHCRCSDGWIGTHCESPCPAGYYGTMCKSSCNCNTTRCHHVTGKCLADEGLVMFDNITRILENNYSGESTERISAEQWIKVESSSTTTTTSTASTTTLETSSTPINSTYAESYQEYLPSNAIVSMVPLENLTSTTEEPSNETVYEIIASTTKLEITFIDTSVGKVESQNPESTTAKRPEVIYLATQGQSDLVELIDAKESPAEESQVDNRQAVATISCLILTLALLLSVVAYMKNLNRKQKQPQHQEQSVDSGRGSISRGPDSPRILEPLPDLPKVTYTKVKAKNQRSGSTQLEHYDVPVNNSSVHKSSPYNYNFTLSKPPAQARKYSLEHIYDEIQYPPYSDLDGIGGGPNASSDHFSRSILAADDKMTPVKVIDEIKGK